MADFSHLKRKGLGAPPPPTEVKDNLSEPETAPAETAPAAVVERSAAPKLVRLPPAARSERDGRSARRTGRTVQFATRVSDDFDRKFRSIAKRDKLLMVDLLEQALAAYEKTKG